MPGGPPVVAVAPENGGGVLPGGASSVAGTLVALAPGGVLTGPGVLTDSSVAVRTCVGGSVEVPTGAPNVSDGVIDGMRDAV